MGFRKIVWNKRAIKQFTAIFLWYRDECGYQYSSKFFKGIIDTIETISQMPSIGKREDSYKGNTVYYSFLAHPKYRIIYRFSEKELYIVSIRCTLQADRR